MKTAPFFFIAALFFLLNSDSPAMADERSHMPDSLYQALSHANDSLKIHLYNGISDWWIYNDADSSRHYAYQALRIAVEQNNLEGQAYALQNVGVAHRAQGMYDSALLYLERAREIWLQRSSPTALAAVYNDLGILYDERSHNTRAIELYLKAVKIYEAADDERGMAKVYNNLGIIYKKEERFEKSLEYYRKALGMYDKLAVPMGIAICQGNIGSVLFELGELDESIIYSLQSIEKYRQLQLDQYVPYSMTNVGMAHMGKGNYTEAEKWFGGSLILYEKYGNKKEQAFTLNSLSEVFYATRRYARASTLADESYKLAFDTGAANEIRLSSKSKALALEALGKFPEALESWKIYTTVNDSLLRKDRTRAVAELQTQYETEKKEQEIELLQAGAAIKDMEVVQAHQLNLMMLLFIILAIAIGAMAFAHLRYKQRIKEAEEKKTQQKERFKAVIETEEKERKRIAQELHDGIGQVLTAARLNLSILEGSVAEKLVKPLSNSAKLLNDAIGEVRNISHNMMPKALMGGSFSDAVKDTVEKINSNGKVKIHLEGEWSDNFFIEEEPAIALYRIIQELLNNAIKYSGATVISLEFSRCVNGVINLSISDNGSGFDTSLISRSSGIGWKSIYSRVEMLNGQIAVQSQPYAGTRIQLNLAS